MFSWRYILNSFCQIYKVLSMVKKCVRLSTQKNGCSQSEWGEDRHRHKRKVSWALVKGVFIRNLDCVKKLQRWRGTIPMTCRADAERQSTQIAPGWRRLWIARELLTLPFAQHTQGAAAAGHRVWAEPWDVRTKGPARGSAALEKVQLDTAFWGSESLRPNSTTTQSPRSLSLRAESGERRKF